ncbi:hypothetical protein TSUD_287590 [Trifolium subterraneum]|uniref:Uncharacterized protein n=1 Tax=Trifolium subterraneum TaxID=3900 RepID=A0A2Z6PKL5_TRISU|nr:hypothetical protein TSUD_287590 [Trifolium subterraneum]
MDGRSEFKWVEKGADKYARRINGRGEFKWVEKGADKYARRINGRGEFKWVERRMVPTKAHSGKRRMDGLNFSGMRKVKDKGGKTENTR